jgi:hypothetical protein
LPFSAPSSPRSSTYWFSAGAISAPPATGFLPPLGSGDYAVWIQETGVCGPSLCNYGFDFTLAEIPEPASGAIVLTGLALLAALRRHRRSRSRLMKSSSTSIAAKSARAERQ